VLKFVTLGVLLF